MSDKEMMRGSMAETTENSTSSTAVSSEKGEITTERSLGKRATSHPPAISEKEYLANSDGSNDSLDEKQSKSKGTILAFTTLGLCCAVFMITLDQTIVATAIPKIAQEFNSLGDSAWYGSAYLLTIAAFQLPFGKLYSRMTVKYVFLAAIGVFEIGSIICAAAVSSEMLIAGRTVAGLGGAGVYSGTLIIAAHVMPLQYRPIYTGALGAISGIAAICGPILGGALTNGASWRWCFWINLPLGGLTIAIVALLTPTNKKPSEETDSSPKGLASLAEFDLLGMVTLIPCIICCLLALQWGGTVYQWKSGRIIGLFAASFVLLCCFIAIQIQRQDRAMLPPRVLKNRSVAGASWFSLAVGSAFFIDVYYLPLWFQAIKGASPQQSGVMNLALVLAVVVVSIIAGGLVTALGYYTPFMIICAAVTAVGCGLLTLLEPGSPPSQWIGYQVVLGVGLGLGMQQPLMAVQVVLDLSDVATGTALVVFAQTVGGSVMLLAAQNLFQNELRANLAADVPSVNAESLLSSGSFSSVSGLTPSEQQGLLQAYNGAITTTLYMPTALAALGILGAAVMEWKSVKGKKLDPLA